MNHQRIQRLKPLLDRVPPGFMVDTPWLRGQGIDPKSIHNYVAQGWLERVIRGVYRRPQPKGVKNSSQTSWAIPLLSLQWIMEYDVHLGGESALDLFGYSHYLSLGTKLRVHFYGHVPSWLRRLPTESRIVVHRRTLFGDDPIGIVNADHNAQADGWEIYGLGRAITVAVPERAILEALDELPNHTSFDNLDKIFEGLTSLRPKQLMELLTACQSIKVRRLFFVFANRHQHTWLKHLDTSKINFGSGPRALVEGGRIHPIYRIYVPKDFTSVNGELVNADA